MKDKTIVPKGYTKMSERSANRNIYKSQKFVMCWVHNRNTFAKNGSQESIEVQEILNRQNAQEILARRKKWVATHAVK